ncbi:MAG: LptF/LptG family permease, partial [Flavobacteriaceae bacterium]|nr:LptF/LptG family permease [Flavobacteriaceae bacterium]
FYAGATFVPLALPLAILLSSLMTFGNLGEHYELVAMKASGISTSRIMKPLVILSFSISILAFVFSNNVLPYANLKFQSLLYDIRQQKLAFNIHEGVFYNGIDNYILRIGEKDRDGKTIYDVRIYDHTARLGNIKVTTAKSGIMELSPDQSNMIFTLFDGYSFTDIYTTRNYRENRPFERTTFKQQRIKFDLSQFDMTRTQQELFKSHHTMLNIKQLNQFIDSLDSRFTERRERYVQNFYLKYQYLSTLDTVPQIVEQTPFVFESKKKILIKRDTAFVPKNDSLTSKIADSTLLAVNDSIVLHNRLKWPLLENFMIGERFNIIELALNAARSNRDNIVFNKNDFEFQGENIRKHEIAWHKKFTLSIACLILF